MRFVYYDYEDGGLMFPLDRKGRRRFNRVKETWLFGIYIQSGAASQRADW